jgi:phage repressor protein C with HTH and peptisase S24 domain
MWPTLGGGEIVFASPLNPVIPGSVVVAKVNGREYIKRVISISNNQFELIGDNYENSYDSRKFGMVNRSDILGAVIGYPASFGAMRHNYNQSQ